MKVCCYSWWWFSAGPVILESPALPVKDGEDVTLQCRNKTIPSNFTTYFYKNGLLVGNSSTGQMIISNVSKSDEGRYKCNISGAGESPESRLVVGGERKTLFWLEAHFYSYKLYVFSYYWQTVTVLSGLKRWVVIVRKGSYFSWNN